MTAPAIAPAAVRERPILFSGPMVRAILAGRKTQTRRVVHTSRRAPWHRMEPAFLAHRWTVLPHPGGGWWGIDVPDYQPDGKMVPGAAGFPCPYGAPGDRLWVRESHYRWTGCQEAPPDWVRSPDAAKYQSRGFVGIAEHDALHESAAAAVTVSARFMPRWASRLTLDVTGVRVERLQDASIDDILAEGIERDDDEANAGQYWREMTGQRFAFIWDRLNAKRGFGWDANPWVWVVEFRRTEEA